MSDDQDVARGGTPFLQAPRSRRQFMQGLGALAVGGSAAAFLSACSGTSSSGTGSSGSGGSSKAGFFFDSLADEWYIDETRAAKQALDGLGVKLQTYAFGSDPSAQIGEIQTAVNTKTSMMAIYTPLGQGLRQIADVANSSKVFFDLEADIPPWTFPATYGDAFGAYVCPADTAPAAQQAAENVFKQYTGEVKAVWMPAIPGGQDNEQPQLGFQAALTAYPNVKVLATGNGKYDRETAFNLMTAWLSQFPQIDVLLSHVDTQSLGAYQAMKNAKRTDTKIISCNGQVEGLEAVKAGQIYSTVFKGPLPMGGWRVVHLYDLAHGWKPSPLERMFWLGCFNVTQENVDKALTLYKNSTLPYDWRKMSRVLNPNDWELQMPLMPINPVTYWQTRNVGAPEPKDWLPSNVKQAIDNGEFEKLVSTYKAHIGNNPLASYGAIMQPEYGSI